VRAIRDTNGVVTAVSDDEILEAKSEVDASGVGCEPASAASVAGVRQLRERGTIGADERVVCVLTGHLLKDTETAAEQRQRFAGAGDRVHAPVAVPADVQALERVLRGNA
jgi:threonine synthase